MKLNFLELIKLEPMPELTYNLTQKKE